MTKHKNQPQAPVHDLYGIVVPAAEPDEKIDLRGLKEEIALLRNDIASLKTYFASLSDKVQKQNFEQTRKPDTQFKSKFDDSAALIDQLLDGFGLTQAELAHSILKCAPRSLTLWKSGKSPNASVDVRLRELHRLYNALAEIMVPAEISSWIRRTNEYLNPLTPLDVLAAGQTDRLWHIIHNVGSGMPT